ncbi:MAG: hypothetical protein GY950_00745 [bacterium]|nr:hypothetical protein [bacterium]
MFFLTADTGEGRGVYICTAVNTWRRLNVGGSGPVLPPAGNDGDVFILNVAPWGIYQWYNLTWNIIGGGGPTTTVGPVTFNDFSDAGLWLPIGSNYVTRALAPAGMTLTGNTARALHWSACGVSSLFKVFGDPVTGDFEIEVTFDQYSRVTDHFANDEYLYGVWLVGSGRGAGGVEDFMGIAYGGLTGGNQDFVSCNDITPNNFDFSLGSVVAAAVPAATTFTLRLQASDILWTGSTAPAVSHIRAIVDGGGGPYQSAIAQVGGYIQMPVGFTGFRLFVGCYHTISSNTAVARATGVTITTGQVVVPL